MNFSRRLAGSCGIAFVVLSAVIAVTAPPLPTVASPASEVRRYYSLNAHGFLAGNYLGAGALIPAFVLLAYLVLLIRAAEGQRARLWVLAALTNGVALATALPIFAMFQTAAVSATIDPARTVKALSDAANMFFVFFFVPMAAATAALAWAFLATGVLHRFVGWAGLLVSAVLLVASAGAVVTSGPLAAGGAITLVAFAAFLAWDLAISVILLVTRQRQLSSTQQTVTP